MVRGERSQNGKNCKVPGKDTQARHEKSSVNEGVWWPKDRKGLEETNW